MSKALVRGDLEWDALSTARARVALSDESVRPSWHGRAQPRDDERI